MATTLPRFQLRQAVSLRGSMEKPNEDGYVIADNIFAVIDGATGRTKGGRRFYPDAPEGSDAAWFTARACAAIKGLPATSSDLRDDIRALAAQLKNDFVQTSCPYPDVEKFEVPSAAMVVG